MGFSLWSGLVGIWIDPGVIDSGGGNSLMAHLFRSRHYNSTGRRGSWCDHWLSPMGVGSYSERDPGTRAGVKWKRHSGRGGIILPETDSAASLQPFIVGE